MFEQLSAIPEGYKDVTIPAAVEEGVRMYDNGEYQVLIGKGAEFQNDDLYVTVFRSDRPWEQEEFKDVIRLFLREYKIHEMNVLTHGADLEYQIYFVFMNAKIERHS